MIKNLWKNTKFCCGYRHDPVEMIFNDRGETLFYSCPKYYPENRTSEEQACPMRLNTVDAEAIIGMLSDKIESDIKKGIDMNYTGYTFKYRQIEVEVLEYSPDKIRVQILNKKALK